MNSEERLNAVADRYRALGFKVVLRPGAADLPPFAKDFKVEILATRDDGGVLVSAKGSASELEADPNVPQYAEITNAQPGWRFDLFVLGPDPQQPADRQEAKEPAEEAILRDLDAVQKLMGAGFDEQALVAAWAALEAAMRRRLRAQGEKASWGTSPRTLLNELYSLGSLSSSVFRELERLFPLRSAIIHGFAVPGVDPDRVAFLVETARRLLTDSQPTRQTA
jgi:hypothetical protein